MSKLKKVKHNFDKVTSQNSTNWKLVIFWIVVFEIFASIVEFYNLENSAEYSVKLESSLTSEIILGLVVTIFVWFCIYNIIFENRKYIVRLLFIGLIGLYFIITNDFSLGFLLQNLNPFHFFNLEFGLLFVIELILKFLILYLVYQFIITLRKNDVISNN